MKTVIALNGKRLRSKGKRPLIYQLIDVIGGVANNAQYARLALFLCLGLAAILIWWAIRPASDDLATTGSAQAVNSANTYEQYTAIAEQDSPPTLAEAGVSKVPVPSANNAAHNENRQHNLSQSFHSQSSVELGVASPYEQDLLATLAELKKGNLQDALTRIDAHVLAYPKSRVGYLLRSDILSAMAQGRLAQDVLKPVNGEFDLEGLRQQLKNRWLHQSNKVAQSSHALVPSALIDFGSSKHVLVADMQASRLYVYRNENNRATLLNDYYMSVGSQGYGKRVEGDNKTPVGVYVVNQFIHPDTLPDLYGSGAFPVDYPNKLDRAKKRTGYGIWLHGTPSSTYARSPWASEGCFVISNEDFEHIQTFIDADEQTPVILAESINWISQNALNASRNEYLNAIEAWRQAWESLDSERYLEFYAREQFNFGQGGFNAWAAQKEAVNERKTFVQVDIDLKGIFEYPGEKDMFVARFTQRYLSNNYSSETAKQQYWQRDTQGRWRIVYEG